MKIDILCSDGSPLGVTSKDIYGEGKRGIGVGGSELALLTMCEEWTKVGHSVCLYNDPKEMNASPFEQRPICTFDSQKERDVLIVFRTPNLLAKISKGKKVWWSCDQFTSKPFKEFAPMVDQIVLISPFHAEHFKKEYDIHNTTVIDLPVRVDEYTVSAEKIPGRCIFSSVPDRGLQPLWEMWPSIRRKVPEASLVITSDYRLWGSGDPHNENHRMMWFSYYSLYGGIQFRGAISRRELVLEQLRAQVHSYPCTYDELFCISVAESQVAGAIPVTTTTGAVETTNMGIVLPGDYNTPKWREEFIETVVGLLNNYPSLEEEQKALQAKALERFNPKRILAEWDEKVFK